MIYGGMDVVMALKRLDEEVARDKNQLPRKEFVGQVRAMRQEISGSKSVTSDFDHACKTVLLE